MVLKRLRYVAVEYLSLFSDSSGESSSLVKNSDLTSKVGLGRFSHLGAVAHKDTATYKPFVAFAFTVNFIFGAGVLGIPAAFVQAGILASLVFLAVVSIIAAITLGWEAEICARAEAWVSSNEMQGAEEEATPRFEVTRRRFEMPELCEIFYGPVMRKVYELSVTFYAISSMWFYCVIFAVSLSSVLPFGLVMDDTTTCDFDVGLANTSDDCRAAYTFYLVLFAVLVCLLTTCNLNEMTRLQVTLTAFASLCLALMIATSTIALIRGPYGGSNTDFEFSSSNKTDSGLKLMEGGGGEEEGGSHVDEETESHISGSVPLFINVAGFGRAFASFVFAQMAHHGGPQLVQLLENKRESASVFRGALGFTFLTYALLGGITALFFGGNIKELVTLNWKGYTAETGYDYPLATLISYVVRLFPAITVLAAFPLQAVTLGDSWAARLPSSFGAFYSERVVRAACRWSAIVPAVLGAAFFNNLSAIISICGLCGFNLMLVTPALLQLRSRRLCSLRWDEACGARAPWLRGERALDGMAVWENGFSGRNTCLFVLVFSVVAFGYTIVGLVTV